MSHVVCHVSAVMCHVSHVMCQCHMELLLLLLFLIVFFLLYFFFVIDKLVELAGGGSVMNGLTPSIFFYWRGMENSSQRGSFLNCGNKN